MHLFFSSATWCAHTHTQVFAFSSLARWWWADAADNRSPGRRRRMQEVGAPYTLSSIWLWWWRGVASGRALIIIIIPIAFPAKQLLSRGPVHHQANCKRYLDYFLQQDLFCLVLVFIYRSGGAILFFFFLLERHACYTLGCCVGLLDPLLFSTLVECNCNGRPDHPNGCVLLVPQR